MEVRELAEPPVPASPPQLEDLDEEPRRLVAALTRSRRGVVRVRSAADRLAVLDLAIRVFQTGHLMIVASTRSAARTVARALRAGRAEPVGCFIRQPTRSDVGIQVGTAGSLDPTVAGVVVFADATQVLHERVRRDVSRLPRQRIYGLLDERRNLSRRERLVIEGYVGPVIGRLGLRGRRTGRGAGRLRRLARRRAAGRTDRTGMEADVDLGQPANATKRQPGWRRPWPAATSRRRGRTACSSTAIRSSGLPAMVGSPSWSSRPSTPASSAACCRDGPCCAPAGRPSATAGERMRPGKIATDRPGQRS